jgi:hypothetical protein
MVQQYTTQTLLPRIAKCIDDIVYENYTMPVSNATKYATAKYSTQKPSESCSYDASAFKLKDALTKDELRRLAIANKLFSQYLNTGSISAAQLRSVLTAEQHDAFNHALKERTRSEEIFYGDGMPVVLKEYNMMLNRADFMWSRYESMPRQGSMKYKHGAPKKIEDRAMFLYERALEHLMEIFTSASGNDLNQLHLWMDREIDFSFNSLNDISPPGVPRTRGSKSLCALDAGLPKLSKRLKRNECALNALVVVAANIAFVFPAVVVDAEAEQLQSAVLKDKLRTLKKARD